MGRPRLHIVFHVVQRRYLGQHDEFYQATATVPRNVLAACRHYSTVKLVYTGSLAWSSTATREGRVPTHPK